MFLHGYSQPVLLLLHESEPSWAGMIRTKVRPRQVPCTPTLQHAPSLAICAVLCCAGWFGGCLLYVSDRIHDASVLLAAVPMLSFAGLQKDTCSLSALSLNLGHKRMPRIWSVQDVPTDAYRLVAVPGGGALVLCMGMILFYSQAQAVGVSRRSGGVWKGPRGVGHSIKGGMGCMGYNFALSVHITKCGGAHWVEFLVCGSFEVRLSRCRNCM